MAEDTDDPGESEGRVRQKEPEPKRPIWIRRPPAHTCGNCGWQFEIAFLHPAMSRVGHA
jgi:hypothetical protein